MEHATRRFAPLSATLPVTLPLLAPLLIKMAIVSAVVVLAARVAERTRPAVAALVATLPFSIGPTYILLALEHDAAFLRTAALVSVAGACATTVFIAAYAYAIPHMRPLPALLTGYLAWAPMGLFVYAVDWTILRVVGLSIVLIAAGYFGTARLRAHAPSLPPIRRWWDVPLRAVCVAMLVGSISTLSTFLGPIGTGALANFPIVMSSMGFIMHLRFGAPAASAMLASSMAGMAGVCAALLAVHLTMGPLSVASSLSLGLLVTVAWNIALFSVNQREFVKKNK